MASRGSRRESRGGQGRGVGGGGRRDSRDSDRWDGGDGGRSSSEWDGDRTRGGGARRASAGAKELAQRRRRESGGGRGSRGTVRSIRGRGSSHGRGGAAVRGAGNSNGSGGTGGITSGSGTRGESKSGRSRVHRVGGETEPANDEYKEWTKLDINGQKIVALSPMITTYQQLTDLYLRDNHLTRLPPQFFQFPGLPNLKVLDLSGNNLHWLQPEICHLLNLKELNLSWNQIRELPVEMGKLFRLETMHLEGNPIVKPANEVLIKGTRYIVSYFRDRMQSGEPPPARVWVEAKNVKVLGREEQLRFCCYNLLAESYAMPERTAYCPGWALAWEYRKLRLLREILSFEADVICLQEVESAQYHNFFEPELAGLYHGFFHPKSRARTMGESSAGKVDGCATFYRKEKLQLASHHVVEFQTVGLRKHDTIGSDALNRLLSKDNIATYLVLKPLPSSSLRFHDNPELNFLLVANTHIHWDPLFCDVKLMQVQLLMEELTKFTETLPHAIAHRAAHKGGPAPSLPTVIAGDFNSLTDSGVYELLDSGMIPPHHADLKNEDYGPYDTEGMSHSLSLESCYCRVLGKEPPFTNYTGDFVGVLDYIWKSKESLVAARALQPLTESIVKGLNGALPNPYMCSDHIPLVVDIQPRI
eukprot:TRINITY_DN523_c0_g1_i1.p1 TRINITY_DN523_c0_g1~~TRINITY_DN523_c0_g1_i1.p1  ORF type:complete len:653 (+),score=89.99 TRINITY_DN523_c0_g1_i1:25-1959(+)